MSLLQEGRDPGQLSAVYARTRRLVPDEDADDAEDFVRQLYRWVPEEDLRAHGVPELTGAALSLWHLARTHTPGTPLVRAFVPSEAEHGWRSPHTVVQVVSDDMPFLVDSVRMALQRLGCDVLLLVHPVVAGQSLMHVEIDRRDGSGVLDDIRDEVLDVLGDVRSAVEDWPKMVQRTRELRDGLDETGGAVPSEEVAEAGALLDWLADGHFLFLGYREYTLMHAGEDVALIPVDGTGLGILRRTGQQRSGAFARLPQRIRSIAHLPRTLTLTKSNARSTVHRPVPMDYIGVKRFDEQGRVIGERRLLGLLTGRAYKADVTDVPIVRRKARQVLERAALPPGGHDEKALLDILDTYPRDELFQVDEATLFDHAIGILGLGERQFVRVFARRDEFERFVSFLVYLPRERFHTDNRLKIQEILRGAVDGTGTDFDLRLTESVLVRLHIVITTEPGDVPDIDVWEIEERISEATRSWTDDLRLALRGGPGGSGADDWRRYATAFPVVYRADNPVAQAVRDIRSIDDLYRTGGLDVRLYRSVDGLRCRVLTWKAALELSDVVPILEHMGVRVADERPYEITPVDAPVTHISDFGLDPVVDAEIGDDVRQAFEDVLWRALTGRLASDRINGLILGAGLQWRDTIVLRTITRYLRQGGTTFSDHYLMSTLLAHADIAGMLVELFAARLDPEHADPARAAELDARIAAEIEAVASLDEDRILTLYLAVVRAVLRTNHWVRTDTLALKLDSSAIALLPQPRPWVEVFVYSQATEGVHLRGGPVARGGLRWSDRPEDYRTEVLGLMKAQMVKNALIVPRRRQGRVRGEDRARSPTRGYRTFMRGCSTSPTTSSRAGSSPPAARGAPRRRRYLPRRGGGQGHGDVLRPGQQDRRPTRLLARRRVRLRRLEPATTTRRWASPRAARGCPCAGTSTTSASTSTTSRSLSSGSATCPATCSATGCCCRGTSSSSPRSTIGTFSSTRTRTPARSASPSATAVRAPGLHLGRLRPRRSSPRAAASGRAPRRRSRSRPQARVCARCRAESMPADELIQAILRAPVDLLWNGGVGTYVKGSERDARRRRAIRPTTRSAWTRASCAAAVIGEGGNLGLTQRAASSTRSAAAASTPTSSTTPPASPLSDHEVNLKILLHGAIEDGSLAAADRDVLLAVMRDAVGERVIEANRAQALALSLEHHDATHLLDGPHRRHPRPWRHAAHSTATWRGCPTTRSWRTGAARGRASPSPSWRSCWPTPR